MNANFQGQKYKHLQQTQHVLLPFPQGRRAPPHRRPGQSQGRTGTGCRGAGALANPRDALAIAPHGFPSQTATTKYITSVTPGWRGHREEGAAARPLCWSVPTAPTWAAASGMEVAARAVSRSHSHSHQEPRAEPEAGRSPAPGLDQPGPETGHRVHPHVHTQINPTLLYAPRVHSIPHPEFTSHIHTLYPS